MIDKSLNQFKIQETMKGYIIGDQSISNNVLKVYIPLLMPLIDPADRITKSSYISNVYVNEGEKPAYNRVVTQQHYINVPLLHNHNVKNENGIIKDGTEVLIMCLNKNINNMYILSFLKE